VTPKSGFPAARRRVARGRISTRTWIVGPTNMVITLPSGEIRGAEKYRKLVAAGFAWAEPVSFDVHHLAFTTDVGDVDVALADWTIRGSPP